ncbi:hypothetical protein GGR52DRAFT_591079 [Hypoxylon sp. FL1284]|nr:hypothetical protein GGR52DRAFT_591079 [Hypoxylon sp. FL1284]
MFFSQLLPLALVAAIAEGRSLPRTVALSPNMLPVIDPLFDYDAIEAGLNKSLPLTEYRLEMFTNGEIPQDCKDRAEGGNSTAADFEVFKVSYTDCDQPWIMCRHKEADVDADKMATVFGQMPLGMREFTKHVMVVKPEAIPHACGVSSGDTIIMSDECYTLHIFAHEMSHSIDSHQEVPGFTPPGQGGFSDSQHWKEEYSKDSATITAYAQTSWSEKEFLPSLFRTSFGETTVLAEVGAIALFHNVVSRGVHSLAHDPQSVFHQYATYQTAYRDLITPRKKPRCTSKAQDSPLVHGGTGHQISAPPTNGTRYKIGTTANPGALGNHTCAIPHPLPKIPVAG